MLATVEDHINNKRLVYCKPISGAFILGSYSTRAMRVMVELNEDPIGI